MALHSFHSQTFSEFQSLLELLASSLYELAITSDFNIHMDTLGCGSHNFSISVLASTLSNMSPTQIMK